MSEQSSQQPDRTAVHDPKAAGFPAEKPALDSRPTPDQGLPAQTDLALPPGDHADHDPPQDLRTAPRLTSPSRHGKRLIPAQDAQCIAFTPPQRLLILDSGGRPRLQLARRGRAGDPHRHRGAASGSGVGPSGVGAAGELAGASGAGGGRARRDAGRCGSHPDGRGGGSFWGGNLCNCSYGG
jgi:hypothetical protein